MQKEEPQLEVLAPTALESITRGEIDLQIATAHRFPRSMAVFKKRALDMATLDEETAESCIYCRPVGMKEGKQQYAEGMSIRMAEIVGASYGNIRVGSMIVEQTERMVKCRGMAHDLETNFASTSECVEATVTRNGAPFSENMRAVVAKACLAKAWRDALFKVVPKALCKPIETEVRKLMTGDAKSLETRRAAVMQWVSKLGIDTARVFAAIGIKGEEDIGSEQLILLTGLKTALKEGDTTIEETFPPVGATTDGAPKFVPRTSGEPPDGEPPTTTPAESTQQPLPKARQAPPRRPRSAEPMAEPTEPSETPHESPTPPASIPTTAKTPEAPQPPAGAQGWRDFVLVSKAENFNGRKLGDLNPVEMQTITDYLAQIDKNRATLYQKKLAAMHALALADTGTPPEKPEHTRTLLDALDASDIDYASFLAECKKSGWIEESRHGISDITEEEAATLLGEWDAVKEACDTVP